jgi:hypothetical protein
MGDAKVVERRWVEDILFDELRLRCAYERQGKEVLRFTVQLELKRNDLWQPIVRYDNAHGFCHRDTLHPDATQEKTRVFVGDLNATFTYAIADLRANWQSHRDRFIRELKS